MNLGSAPAPLAVVGCDFRVASTRLRSRLVLEAPEARLIVADLSSQGISDGFVDLNTCNRNEWIVSTAEPQRASALLRRRMQQRARADAPVFEPYAFAGEAAARHVLRVAVGQESLVVGERQIASQLFRALQAARCRGTSSRVLNGIGPIAGRLVRDARRRGCVGSAAIGVHSLAVSYLRHHLPDAARQRVAIVGLGCIGRRVLGRLQQDPRCEPVCCNRTINAEQQGRIWPLERLSELLEGVRAVIVCTNSPRPLLKAAQLRRRRDGLLVIDTGIPEQVEREALPDRVQLAGLDELTAFHRERHADRCAETTDIAGQLVERAVAEFQDFCREPLYAAILARVHQNHRRMLKHELPRLVANHLSRLDPAHREAANDALHQMLAQSTASIFDAIRAAARKGG